MRFGASIVCSALPVFAHAQAANHTAVAVVASAAMSDQLPWMWGVLVMCVFVGGTAGYLVRVYERALEMGT